MNSDEKIAFEYLRSIGNGIPEYEPNGKIPPDFTLEDKIGVEVRRLNQNYFEGEKIEGIEQVSIKMKKILETCFESFNSKYIGETYFVVINYKRPIIDDSKTIKKGITSTLQRFLDNPLIFPATFKVNDKISFQFVKANKKYEKLFKLGITQDFNNGGWLTQLFVENVTFCVDEKSKKIDAHKEKYKEWWLLLVDHIGLDMPKEDYDEIDFSKLSKGNFDKILIIYRHTYKELFSY